MAEVDLAARELSAAEIAVVKDCAREVEVSSPVRTSQHLS
jgi:hypothetical protein